MFEKPEEMPGSKCVVIIGDLTQEGVTAKLKSLGYYYHHKRLHGSNPQNWQAVVDLVASRSAAGTLIGVFMDLTIGVLACCRDSLYEGIWISLIQQLREVRTTVYVYENTLLGDFSGSVQPVNAELKSLIDDTIQSMQNMGLSLLPFQKRHEVTSSIVHVLEELEAGVLLRLYVPEKRYQSEQLNSFLHLFESYLKTVEKVSFSIDQRKTDHGRIYIFSSKTDLVSTGELNSAIARFQEFMEVREHNTASAKEILTAASIKPPEAEAILARFSRDYRRLKLDARHEFEHKSLLLRQRLEGDIVDASAANDFRNPMQPFVATILSLAGNSGPICINLTNNSVSSANDVAQLVNGDITYTLHDSQITTLIDQYSQGLDAITLKSALSELKDESSTPEAKSTAGQKVKGFLYKVASNVGEVAVKGLAAYVEHLITGKP